MGSEGKSLGAERVGPDEVRGLRNEVLRPGQPIGSTNFDGDDHPLAAHFMVRSSGSEVVSVGSIHPEPPPWEPDRAGAWRVRGMATEERSRRKGHGRCVLDALMDHAVANGGELVWCIPRIGALDFNRHAGFETIGAVFDNGIALHQSMWRALSGPAGGTSVP